MFSKAHIYTRENVHPYTDSLILFIDLLREFGFITICMGAGKVVQQKEFAMQIWGHALESTEPW